MNPWTALLLLFVLPVEVLVILLFAEAFAIVGSGFEADGVLPLMLVAKLFRAEFGDDVVVEVVAMVADFLAFFLAAASAASAASIATTRQSSPVMMAPEAMM